MKCSECVNLSFAHGKGQPSRYYCTHSNGAKAKLGNNEDNAVLVQQCERGSEMFTQKYAPNWCPMNNTKLNTKKVGNQ